MILWSTGKHGRTIFAEAAEWNNYFGCKPVMAAAQTFVIEDVSERSFSSTYVPANERRECSVSLFLERSRRLTLAIRYCSFQLVARLFSAVS